MTTTEMTELRSEAAIYAAGTCYSTDDLVRAYQEYLAECEADEQESDDCQRYFERYLATA